MAVITTTTLVVAGIVAGVTAIGTAGTIVHHNSTEDSRLRAKISRLEQANSVLRTKKNEINNIIDDLTKAIEKLTSAESTFKNGGHVLDGKPIAHEKFTNNINKLKTAKSQATSVRSEIESEIAANSRAIRQARAKLG